MDKVKTKSFAFGRISTAAIISGAALGQVVFPAPPAGAWCPTGQKWANAGPHDVFNSTSSVPQGWNSALRDSAKAWNGVSNWSFNYYDWGQHGPPYQGGWVGAASFSQSGVKDDPGVTYTNAGSMITGAQTYLNTDWQWNTNGTMDEKARKADVRNVAQHEFGHWIGLHHPNTCGPSKPEAVMEPNFVTKYALSQDDIDGVRALYG